MKHTKGPWEVKGNHHLKSNAYWITNIGICDDQIEANARLIAAAPDLLAACKKLFSAVGDELSACDYKEIAENPILAHHAEIYQKAEVVIKAAEI